MTAELLRAVADQYADQYAEPKEGPMGWSKRDDRDAREKADWDAGAFTEEEAAQSGMTAAEANRARAEQERALGNPLAPPE